MSAMVLTGHGGYDKLVYREDVPVPRPRAGEVLIQVGAAGLNNTDINTRIGWYAQAKEGDEAEPRDGADLRLRYAFQAARLLVDAYGDRQAKAWFLGTNTRLDDEAPAYVLRGAETPEELRFLVPAARAFVGAAS